MIIKPIIIVEDDEDECNFLTSAIRRNGYNNQFLCFHNPVDALIYLRSAGTTALIIISDINMPYMNGISFKQAIEKDVQLNTQNIPFVFLSGFVDHIDAALRLSVAACIKKPSSISAYDLVAKTILAISDKTMYA